MTHSVPHAASAALAVAIVLAACGGGGSAAVTTAHRRATTAPAAATGPAQPAPRARTRAVVAALRAVERAVRRRDVGAMCRLMVASTITGAHGSRAALRSALAAETRDCESGFGRRGEFNGYTPLVGARVTSIHITGGEATVRVDTDRGAGTVRFFDADGWRLLVAVA